VLKKLKKIMKKSIEKIENGDEVILYGCHGQPSYGWKVMNKGYRKIVNCSTEPEQLLFDATNNGKVRYDLSQGDIFGEWGDGLSSDPIYK
jgi:hypothetical protein